MPENSDTMNLLSQISAGDQRPFADLFSLYRDRLKQMLAHHMDHRLQKRVDLSDILQDVYIDALKRVQHYLAKPDYSFYVWLRQVAMQRLIEVHRQHLLAERRSLRAEVPLAAGNSTASHAWAIQLVANQVSPSQVAMHDELVHAVMRTLDAMDPIDREVLALRHFEDMRNSEVAETLGLSIAAASNRYVRALVRLREALLGDTDSSQT